MRSVGRTNSNPHNSQFEAAMVDAREQFPEGFQTAAGKQLATRAAKQHDEEVAFKQRIYGDQFTQAYREASQAARKGGVNVQYDEQGFPSIDLTSKAAGTPSKSNAVNEVAEKTLAKHLISTDEFAARTNARRVDKDGNGKNDGDFMAVDIGKRDTQNTG